MFKTQNETIGAGAPVWDSFATSGRPGPPNSGPRLDINVVFTTPQGSRTALQAAENLAEGLESRIFFVVPQVVPRSFSLTSPPIPVPFIEERCTAMAEECEGNAEIRIQVYLCTDLHDCVLHALKPRSLVVIGGRKRWWPTAEQRLARLLQDCGHHVIFVPAGDRDQR